MTPTRHVFAIPDLEILVCPDPGNPNDRTFYDRNWRIFQQHTDILQEKGFHWLFSAELCQAVLAQYPWNHLSECKWLVDVYSQLQLLFGQYQKVLQCTPAHSTRPDMLPIHTLHPTDQAWLATIAWRCTQSNTEACIPTLENLHHPAKQVDLLDAQDSVIDTLPLVRNEYDWRNLHEQVDPWFQAGLPDKGQYSYRPPTSWRAGQPFPVNQAQRGFVDARGRVWVWDKLHDDHWDVQYDPPRHNNYDRVTPDGRLLDGQD